MISIKVYPKAKQKKKGQFSQIVIWVISCVRLGFFIKIVKAPYLYTHFIDKSPPTSSKSNVNAKQRHKTQFINSKTAVAAKTGVRNRAASVASSRVSSIDSDHAPPVAPSTKKTNKSNKNQATRASISSDILGIFQKHHMIIIYKLRYIDTII